MTRKGIARIQRGQAITFRLPSDTPEHIIKQLQKLKETERRNFSSKIAEFALEGVSKSLTKEKETVTIPLPRKLSKEQRNWLKHSHSEALLGSIVYQLLLDPVRATAILASLNSNALDIDDALFLQETDASDIENNTTQSPLYTVSSTHEETKETSSEMHIELSDDDLEHFDLDKAKKELTTLAVDTKEEVVEEDEKDLLSDFIAQMNK